MPVWQSTRMPTHGRRRAARWKSAYDLALTQPVTRTAPIEACAPRPVLQSLRRKGYIREQQIGEQPAAPCLEWIHKLQTLIAEQPGKFAKVVTPTEKKLLEDLLERSLGVKRRKPPPRKAPRPSGNKLE